MTKCEGEQFAPESPTPIFWGCTHPIPRGSRPCVLPGEKVRCQSLLTAHEPKLVRELQREHVRTEIQLLRTNRAVSVLVSLQPISANYSRGGLAARARVTTERLHGVNDRLPDD